MKCSTAGAWFLMTALALGATAHAADRAVIALNKGDATCELRIERGDGRASSVAQGAGCVYNGPLAEDGKALQIADVRVRDAAGREVGCGAFTFQVLGPQLMCLTCQADVLHKAKACQTTFQWAPPAWELLEVVE